MSNLTVREVMAEMDGATMAAQKMVLSTFSTAVPYDMPFVGVELPGRFVGYRYGTRKASAMPFAGASISRHWPVYRVPAPSRRI